MQLLKFHMSVGTKIVLDHKRHSLSDCDRLGQYNKEWAKYCISRSLSVGRDIDIVTVSQKSPRRQIHLVRQSLDLEKLMCNPRWTNKEDKKKCSLFCAYLVGIRTKISSKCIIQKCLHWQRNNMGLVNNMKGLGPVTSQKGKTFSYKKGIDYQTKHKNDNDAWW